MSRISLISIIVFLSACAGPNPPGNPRQLQLTQGVIDLVNSDESITLADHRIHCEQIKMIGSNFPQRTCMLKTEADNLRMESLRSVLGPEQWGSRSGLGAERANSERR